MQIVIDIDENGNTHWIGVDHPGYPLVAHPDGSGRQVDTMTMLLHHNANPQAREVGGWHVSNQLPGETAPRTRWERLVDACNHPDAPAHIRALGLKS